MYKKLISGLLCSCLIISFFSTSAIALNGEQTAQEMASFSAVADSVFNSSDFSNNLGTPALEETFIDSAGDEIGTQIFEYENGYVVIILLNGAQNQVCISDRQTGDLYYREYDNAGTSLFSNYTEEMYNISDFISLTDDTGLFEEETPEISTMGALPIATGYNITNSYRTDYIYRGSILYGDTYTRAYEPSASNRYNGRYVTFTVGDGVGLVLAALVTAFTLPAGATFIAVSTLVALGLPIAGAKVVEYFTSNVYYTTYNVSTKVYYSGIYTGLISQNYNKVLVAYTPTNTGSKVGYSDDYYGYNIISSNASYAASGCARAFNDKYITMNNPNLSLPITSLPYYG